MQLATLKDAMRCIQTPTASRKIAACPAAEVLRNEETITSPHKEEIKNFMQTRDKKIRISKQPVTNVAKEAGSSSQPPANTTVDSPCHDKQIDRRSKVAYMAMQIYFRERILDWASRLVWTTVPCNMQLPGGLPQLLKRNCQTTTTRPSARKRRVRTFQAIRRFNVSYDARVRRR